MSAAKSWIVQTGFGARLGPMPDEALRKLVRTGALVRTDQVCEGAAGEWQSAGEIPGLFESGSSSQSAPTGSCSPSLTGLIPPAPHLHRRLELEQTTEPSAPPATANATVLAVPKAFTFEPPVVAAITAAPVSPESELINAWKMNRGLSKVDLGMASLADEMTQAKAVEDLAPELPSDLFDDVSAVSSDAVVPVSKTSRSSQQRPAFLDQVPSLEVGPRQAVETIRQKRDRWQRSLPSRPVAVVLVAAFFTISAIWWFWPRSQRTIYDRYVALWSEWKQRRGDLKDNAGWERFLRHADAELNDIVPWLQKNTRATDNEKRLLLFIGHDCLKKIRMQPRQQGMPQEKQLESLLAQARERYEPSAPAAPRDAFIGAKSVLPKKSRRQPEMMNRPSGVVPVLPDPSKLPLAVPKPAEESTPP
ncbi:MAG: hypothetical protein DWI21_00520 [Planctomycetota bacterium]|nr:MAG: hypothetical protein DWI21_00520 [Planctomycetota bacterium]